MPGRRIQIDIIGPQPNEVDIRDLASVLEDLSNAVGACLPKDADHRGRVSLVEIVNGSDGLVLEVQPMGAAAIAELTGALSTRKFDSLPRAAHEALYRVAQFVTKRRWGLRFPSDKKLGVRPVEVVRPDHVPAPETRSSLMGGTTVLARCLRVGGATRPKAELRLVGGKLLHVEVSEGVARELGKRLYDEVVLSGDAVWDAHSGELREFKVQSVSTFRKVPVTDAFAELARAARGRLDELDAESYVKGLRESSG
jgi:hypothetical protein